MRGKRIVGLVLVALALVILAGWAVVGAQGGPGCAPTVVDRYGVPHPFSWLQAQYPGIECVGVGDPAQEHFAIDKITWMISGDALLRLWVRDANGFPIAGQPMTYWYPWRGGPSGDLPLLSAQWKTRCSPRGVQNKNTSSGFGNVDFQLGSESWIKGGRGVYGGQVLSLSAESECFDGTGWIGGTNHEGPVEVFFKLVPAAVASPTPAPATATPLPGVTPTPVPPGAGDLAETNGLLRELLAALQKLSAHLGVP